MITFESKASSSRGNAYILRSQYLKPLLIEAGLPLTRLREALAFQLSTLAGCLISHSHGDHSKGAKGLLAVGVNVYAGGETARALGITDHHRYEPLFPSFEKNIDGWKVVPFTLNHDCECLGFYVCDGSDGDRFVFIPDTGYVTQRFVGINQIAAECNYIDDLLEEGVAKGNVPAAVAMRTRSYHLSLNALIEALAANDLSQCRRIYLMHLSNAYSDAKRMKDETEKATGIETYIVEEKSANESRDGYYRGRK